jgi:hypothetical protein
MDRLRDLTANTIQMPAEHKGEYNLFFDTLQITDSNSFEFNNNAYKTDPKTFSDCKHISFWGTAEPSTGKYTIITVDVSANFKIAQDLYLWEKQTSKFGGLFQTTKQEFTTRPHDITLEEVDILMKWFESVTLKAVDSTLRTIITGLGGTPPAPVTAAVEFLQ